LLLLCINFVLGLKKARKSLQFIWWGWISWSTSKWSQISVPVLKPYDRNWN